MSTYVTYGLSKEHYVYNLWSQFIRDIVSIAQTQGVKVYLKTKIPLRDQSHNRYDSKTRRFYLDLCRDYSNLEILPKGVSAEEATSNTAYSISMPWTSTALLADPLGKPTFYYDASGSLYREDRGCHGVDLCIGKIELEQKIQTLFDELNHR